MHQSPLFELPQQIETYWASPENFSASKGSGGQALNGRKGSPAFKLESGQSQVLAQAEGRSGTIRRIWATINDRSPRMMRGLRLDIYWDGASKPAVSAPWGDFFGQGLGRCSTFESALFSNPEGRSFNCCIPMPFHHSMKIVLTNESGKDASMIFYDINYTLGDQHEKSTLYFHAHWRREPVTTFKEDYEFLPHLNGRGRFLGVNVGVIANTEVYAKSWWGEGECKIYLDGDQKFPTLCGTGTEDYIGTAWGQGQYANLYQGCHLADSSNFQYNFYRYHIQDPVYFYQNIRVSMQQIGCWGPDTIEDIMDIGTQLTTIEGHEVDMKLAAANKGYGLFERRDDWSSCAYFYLDKPENELPALLPVEERITGLYEDEDASARTDV
ncbi:MAG: DUF2961 domain-containing protein [Lentisphaeria bacterium]|nr:DUF2961 domain-containing protein [Lentisphaeria bacterium]